MSKPAPRHNFAHSVIAAAIYNPDTTSLVTKEDRDPSYSPEFAREQVKECVVRFVAAYKEDPSVKPSNFMLTMSRRFGKSHLDKMWSSCLAEHIGIYDLLH